MSSDTPMEGVEQTNEASPKVEPAIAAAVATAPSAVDTKIEPSDAETAEAAAATTAAAAVAAATIAAATSLVEPETKAKRWTWKKPVGKPKRPLSGYNLFFADVRKDLMADQETDPTTPKLGFTELALHVSERWKNIDPRRKEEYEKLAREAKAKYQVEIAKWKKATSNGTISVGVDQDGNYLEGEAATASAATIDDPPATHIPLIPRCASCPACIALSPEKGLPEPNPIYIVASQEYLSQLVANSPQQQQSRSSILSAADLAVEAMNAATSSATATLERDSKRSADEPEAAAKKDEVSSSEETKEEEELPTVSLSVMPDGSIFHTRSDMQSLNQTKLQQDVTSLWAQVSKEREKLRKEAEDKAAASVRNVPL